MILPQSRARERPLDPIFETAALDVSDPEFPVLAARIGLTLPFANAHDAEISELHAAGFAVTTLRADEGLRKRFPTALSDGLEGPFYRWLQKQGGKPNLSDPALRKIRGAFRRPPGRRILAVYLNDPTLQRLYPLGLLPVGQLHFLEWLVTHGRRDQNFRDEEILWFLHQTAEDNSKSLALTFLLQPKWQEQFPLALTKRGWKQFVKVFQHSLGKESYRFCLRSTPQLLSRADERVLKKSLNDSKPSALLEGVNLLSHFCNPSGIQQAALWTKAALERTGLRTSCRDVPVPRRIVPIDRADWLGSEIFPITILNQAATPYFVNGYERAGLFRRKNVYRIAYWNWELETVPDEWVEVAPLINEIWSPTPFVAKAMRARMPVPVYEMLPGVEVGPIEPIARASLGIPESDFVFLFMFDLHSQLHRKNPRALIHAFEKAFRSDDDVTLVIKTSGGDIFSSDLAELREMALHDKIIVVDELLSRAAAYGMIAMCDCFVSLHRSEGFGLGLAESMLLGKPVVATGYSGNLAFMNRENSLLVDYKMVEISEDRPLYTKGNFWAEPDDDHAAALMRDVYENRGDALERAARAKKEVAEQLSLVAAGRRMRARLEKICTALESNQQPAD